MEIHEEMGGEFSLWWSYLKNSEHENQRFSSSCNSFIYIFLISAIVVCMQHVTISYNMKASKGMGKNLFNRDFLNVAIVSRSFLIANVLVKSEGRICDKGAFLTTFSF